MKKIIVAAAIMATAAPAIASSDHWRYFASPRDNVRAYVHASDSDLQAVNFVTASGKMYAGFMIPEQDVCEDIDKQAQPIANHRVTGQLIQMNAQCIGKKRLLMMPVTTAGADFIHEQFMQKREVTLSEGNFETTFTAKNYKQVFEFLSEEAL